MSNKRQLELKLNQFLAKNPSIPTNNIFVALELNFEELKINPNAEIKLTHTFYVKPQNSKWCFSVCPIVIKKIVPNNEKIFCNPNFICECDLLPYKNNKYVQIQEIFFENKHLKNLINNHILTKVDLSEMLKISTRLNFDETIKFGHLAILQIQLNQLEKDYYKLNTQNNDAKEKLRKNTENEQYFRNN